MLGEGGGGRGGLKLFLTSLLHSAFGEIIVKAFGPH